MTDHCLWKTPFECLYKAYQEFYFANGGNKVFNSYAHISEYYVINNDEQQQLNQLQTWKDFADKNLRF